jgi:conjugal transfer pilus assembly protein TraF
MAELKALGYTVRFHLYVNHDYPTTPMSLLRATTTFLLGAFIAVSAAAAEPRVKRDDLNDYTPEKGWFFGDDPRVEEPPAPEPEPPPPMPTEGPKPPKEDRCKKAATWSASCGFVDPGQDFDFQAKQRDVLFQQMSVSNNDPKAVEAVQYYMRWVLERTSEVTNLWWYNMVQNPQLDPTVTAPVSAFGLRLMTDVRKGHTKEIFDLIKEEGGMFVVFTRSDCVYCHQMVEPLKRLSERTGLPIRNAALDNTCLTAFKEGCLTAPDSLAPAQALQIATVPTVLLYVKPNTWLRVANGVVDTDSMTTRTVQFFSAYRNAMLKGVENGQNGRPSVDFNGIDPSGTAVGAAGADSAGTVQPPSEGDISRMLGQTR